MKLTAKRLREVLHYNPKTGIFTNKIWRGGTSHVGAIAGSLRKDGYISIFIDTFGYLGHRLAWLYVYGKWPSKHIDHVNHVNTDNRIKNLRNVSRSTNLQNRKGACINSKTGVLGVSPYRNKYQAAISIQGKQTNLGHFSTIEKASAAYLAAKRKYHEGCTI